jgi:hypothetical protein
LITKEWSAADQLKARARDSVEKHGSLDPSRMAMLDPSRKLTRLSSLGFDSRRCAF